MKIASTYTHLVMSVALVSFPGIAGAHETNAWSSMAPGEQPTAAERARELFAEGRASYEISRYAEAVEMFEKSLAMSIDIEDPQARERALQGLRFNLARAHFKAYEIDGDATRLRTALDLFDKYLKYGAELENELEAEELSSQVREALRRLEEEGGADSGRRGRASGEDRDGEAQRSPLWIGGISSVVTGVVGFGVMGAGMGIGASAKNDLGKALTGADVVAARDKGRTGNALSVTGAVLGGLLVTTGAVLFVMDKKRSKKVALVPNGTPEYAGLQLTGRF